MSWECGLQETLKLLRIAALDKEAVRVVSVGQEDMESSHALSAKPAHHPLRRRLAASVGVGIQGKIDSPRPVAQLLKLRCVRVIAQ
jgi:hypothetical protein